MRSHLTRRVFRTILRNETLLHKKCVRRLHTLDTRQIKPAIQAYKPHQQARSLWWGNWLDTSPRRVLKPQKIDPGMDVLAEQETLLAIGVRKYKNDDLVEALKEFFTHKKTTGKPVLDTQITPVLVTYKYLLAEREHDGKARLTIDETALFLERLGSCSLDTLSTQAVMLKEENIDAFSNMADLLFNDIRSRETEWPTTVDNTMRKHNGKADRPSDTPSEGSIFFRNCTQKYLDVIAYRLKNATYAKEMFQDLVKNYPLFAGQSNLSAPVVWALAFERKHDELKSFLAWLERTDPKALEAVWSSMIEGAVLAEDFESVKYWWSSQPAGYKDNSRLIQKFTLSITVLKFCITSGNMSWGQNILNDLVGMELHDAGHRGRQVAMILTWAMANGKSVDELEKMFDLMCKRLELSPKISQINTVLEEAKSKRDPYFAERLLNLARKKRLTFDATTYRLEMEWRVIAGDIAGAQVSYDRLRSQEFEIQEISPAINQLLLTMCQREPVLIGKIMSIVDEFIVSQGTFSAELVAALSKLHLQRGEMHDLADLLHTYATSFSQAERELIRNVFVNYVFNTETSGGKWDAYTFMKAIFPETSKELRTKIMQDFFRVRRHDLAMHVFGDMRAAQVEYQRPDNVTYAAFFEGLAHTRNFEALQIAHNMLRLDSQVEPDTNVRTSLMLAYALCDKPGKSLMIWDEIAYMQEGPSYHSINVAFRACQEAKDGLQHARDIWSKLKRQDIEILKETADSYISVLAAQGELEEAFKMVSDLDSISGGHYTADALSIAAVINPTSDEQRGTTLAWAQKEYPVIVEQLEAGGKSPFERRYLLEPFLPQDKSYVGYWNLLGAEDWQLEYTDWVKNATKE